MGNRLQTQRKGITDTQDNNCTKMITNPLVLTALLMSIILLIPLACRKIHIPAIVGFILTGMAVGPSMLNWVGNNAAIQSLGAIGMLYIMFQSGSEIDINDFKQYRYHAIIFGLYTFFFPFGLGVLASHYLLNFSWITSVLLGAMFGSHTLMTYPIVSRYGIQKNKAVNITVGGTMWAITLSLVVLAGIETGTGEPRGFAGNMRVAGLIVLFLACVLWLFPKVARWLFKRYQDPVFGFMLVMLMLVLSSLLASCAGLEGILGAFLCGVSLNRLLPNHSPLMRRITFVGNSIFVPLFLISVGLMIDVHVFWSGWTTLVVAVVMVLSKLTGKSAAAWFGQWTFGFSDMERQLVFGLTQASAAGTLAIATIGYQMGIFTSEVLNGAVLMILILCSISGFITEHAAKQLALQEGARLVSDHDEDYWLLTSVGTDLRTQLRELSVMASLKNIEITQSASWSDVQRSIEHLSKSVLVYHESQPLNTINRILVAVPRYAEKERDFITCFGLIRRLAGELGAKVVFYANPDTQVVLRAMCRRPGKTLRAAFRDMDDWEDVLMIAKDMQDDDMPVLLSSRKATASYNPLFEQIPQMLQQFFADNNYMVVYPEQQTGGPDIDAFLTDVPQASTAWSVVTRLKGVLLRGYERLVRLVRRPQNE